MMRRMAVAGVLCWLAGISAQNASAQVSNMSDVTGATVSLFSRGVVRAFGAPPAPPPTLIVNAPMLEALCLERADAMLRYAALSSEAESAAEHAVLTLLRGGSAADGAALTVTTALTSAGAAAVDVNPLVQALNGLLAAPPQVVNVAAAVDGYNALVKAAPFEFLMRPPAEFAAIRLALGRLTAAANTSLDKERVYPGLNTAEMRYANNAQWLLQGRSIDVGTQTYKQYGQMMSPGDRRYQHIADYSGVWVLAEQPVVQPAPVVYVVQRKYCDVELVPYVLEQKVTKGMSFLGWP